MVQHLTSAVAFTGRLACMSRAEAFEVVRQRGGTPSPDVTKRTKILIVGELGWPLLDDGRPSNKLNRATSPYGIPVVSERRFLEWIGKAVPDDAQKSYSAEQIAALSKMSVDMVRELSRLVSWMIGMAVSGFATWPAPVRLPNCSMTECAYRKSFAPSAKFGNGFLTSASRGSGFMPACISDVQVEQPRRSDRQIRPVRPCRRRAPPKILMSCSIERMPPSRWGMCRSRKALSTF